MMIFPSVVAVKISTCQGPDTQFPWLFGTQAFSRPE